MLSANEFTIGKVGSAKPLSLVVPTNDYEQTFLVGHIDSVTAAVFLSGDYRSHFFESEGNESWGGIIIPDVRIEVDVWSSVDATRTDPPPLCVIRTDTRIVIAARGERSFAPSSLVTLHENLVPAGDNRATFLNWHVVVGKGQEKRVLWSTMDDSSS